MKQKREVHPCWPWPRKYWWGRRPIIKLPKLDFLLICISFVIDIYFQDNELHKDTLFQVDRIFRPHLYRDLDT